MSARSTVLASRQIGHVPQEAVLFTGSVRRTSRSPSPRRAMRSRGSSPRRRRARRAPGAPRWARHRGRRARREPLRGPAPARRPRPREPDRPPDRDPRRGHLGPRLATETRIREALGRLLEGRTALIVAHRLETIRTPTGSSSWTPAGSSGGHPRRVSPGRDLRPPLPRVRCTTLTSTTPRHMTRSRAQPSERCSSPSPGETCAKRAEGGTRVRDRAGRDTRRR